MGIKKRNWWRKKKLRRLSFVTLIVAIAMFFIGVNYELNHAQNGQPGRTVWVNVQSGSSSKQIGQLLLEKGIIQNAFWFRVYLWWSHQGPDLQAGNYPFHTGMTFPQVTNELKSGSVQYNTVMVTIPEGYTVTQIAVLLQNDHLSTVSAFMSAINNGHYSGNLISQLPKNHAVRDRLEGYLFPDTYAFVRGETPQQMIQTMLTQLTSVLTKTRLFAMHKEGLSITQLLTIASMVEREARVSSERPLIASVIFNRLHHTPEMHLRIDATVEYALGFTRGYIQNLTLADLQVNSPYNTYMYLGLPPGPIANPGLASIEAVLHPSHTSYLYYVARNDGTGRSYFATTYAGQLRNEAKSQQNAQKSSH